MQISRRAFLSGTLAGASGAVLGHAAHASIGIDGFTGALDARDFGVEPNATLDQTTIVQDAIVVAAKVGNPLFLPPGRYVVTDLQLPTGTHIVGVPGNTRLLLGRSGSVFRAEDADTISLTGLTVEGLRLPTAADAGILSARNVKSLVVDGCTFTSGTTHGLHLDRCGGRIADSHIWGCGEAGVFSIDATGLRITGNTVTDCENNGILVWRSSKGEDGTMVTENRIERIYAQNGGEGQWGNAVNIFRAGAVTVANNRIADCAFSAVRSNAGSSCQILGNNCSRLGEVAIYAEFDYEGAIIAQNIIDTAATGISMTNFNEGGRMSVCTGNIVRNLFTRDHYDRRGIGISAEADTVVSGNVVEGAPTAGLVLGWGPHLRDVTADGNIVRDAEIGIGVSVADGAGSAVISDNLISGARRGAIVGMAWDKIVADDLTRAASDRFPQLSLSRNRVS